MPRIYTYGPHHSASLLGYLLTVVGPQGTRSCDVRQRGEALRMLGFESIATGGGCTALYRAQRPETGMGNYDGPHILITASEDCNEPHSNNEPVDIGFYRSSIGDSQERFYTVPAGATGSHALVQDILAWLQAGWEARTGPTTSRLRGVSPNLNAAFDRYATRGADTPAAARQQRCLATDSVAEARRMIMESSQAPDFIYCGQRFLEELLPGQSQETYEAAREHRNGLTFMGVPIRFSQTMANLGGWGVVNESRADNPLGMPASLESLARIMDDIAPPADQPRVELLPHQEETLARVMSMPSPRFAFSEPLNPRVWAQWDVATPTDAPPPGTMPPEVTDEPRPRTRVSRPPERRRARDGLEGYLVALLEQFCEKYRHRPESADELQARLIKRRDRLHETHSQRKDLDRDIAWLGHYIRLWDLEMAAPAEAERGGLSGAMLGGIIHDEVLIP